MNLTFDSKAVVNSLAVKHNFWKYSKYISKLQTWVLGWKSVSVYLEILGWKSAPVSISQNSELETQCILPLLGSAFRQCVHRRAWLCWIQQRNISENIGLDFQLNYPTFDVHLWVEPGGSGENANFCFFVTNSNWQFLFLQQRPLCITDT